MYRSARRLGKEAHNEVYATNPGKEREAFFEIPQKLTNVALLLQMHLYDEVLVQCRALEKIVTKDIVLASQRLT